MTARAFPPFAPQQPAEWLPARVALLCEPAIETLFSILHTGAANFLRPFSLAKAREEHRAYRHLLENHGVRVLELRTLLAGADRARLVKWARQAVALDFDPELGAEAREEALAQLEAALQALDADSLVDVLMLRPTLHVAHNADMLDPTTRFSTRFSLAPLSPYYMRDPLITTSAGVVITRLKLANRTVENDLAACALESLGIQPIYRVQPPGTLEGGDFIPCGDFVLQGQGLLTNEAGVRQCLENGVYGHVEVAVVEAPQQGMDEMHLDTYFAMLDRNLAVCLDARLAGDAEPAVRVYTPQGTAAACTYTLTRTVLFSRYLAEKGIQVIPISKTEQAQFAANVLTLGPRRVVAVKQAGAAFLQRLRAFDVDVSLVDFEALSGGYGGPHCASQVLLRA
jgi:arginine deiminase